MQFMAMDTRDESGLSAKPNGSGARPDYIELVKDAILSLNDSNGSSAKAITENIMGNHWVPGGTEEDVREALSEGLQSGILDQVRSSHYKVTMLI